MRTFRHALILATVVAALSALAACGGSTSPSSGGEGSEASDTATAQGIAGEGTSPTILGWFSEPAILGLAAESQCMLTTIESDVASGNVAVCVAQWDQIDTVIMRYQCVVYEGLYGEPDGLPPIQYTPDHGVNRPVVLGKAEFVWVLENPIQGSIESWPSECYAASDIAGLNPDETAVLFPPS